MRPKRMETARKDGGKELHHWLTAGQSQALRAHRPKTVRIKMNGLTVVLHPAETKRQARIRLLKGELAKLTEKTGDGL